MKDETENKNSRRKFLVRTSAVSLISALPATSVWGACTVSGALSGGSKTTNDCSTITLTGGRSHGFWKDISTGNSLDSAFPNVVTDDQINELIILIEAAKALEVPLGNNQYGSPEYMVIGTALGLQGSGSSPKKHLAAVFLNAIFGFYCSSLPVTVNSGETISNGEQLVAHLYALHFISGGQNDSNSYFGFTSGSTGFTPSSIGCI